MRPNEAVTGIFAGNPVYLPSEQDACPIQVGQVCDGEQVKGLDHSDANESCDESPCHWRKVPVEGERRIVCAVLKWHPALCLQAAWLSAGLRYACGMAGVSLRIETQLCHAFE